MRVGERVVRQEGHNRRRHHEHRDSVALDLGENSPTSKRDSVTTLAPAANGTARFTTNPMTWKKGATANIVSRSVTRSPLRTWRTLVKRFVGKHNPLW